ncbi:helix-turn-helix domain-containing protein [Cupriavidus sp. a3]|uniref:helix-turn-helix domain-containing protein n=1 Tax=Cupriavidus sp. a3 TaxID=3242158 RepID=UPI003D9C0828
MPSKPYKVTSLERGLAVLQTLGSADRPLRNRDVVASTGLPKATVSRLTNTLAAMGYLRRTDQGSYVPGHLSARSGRSMLAGLDLAQHAPRFQAFFEETGGIAVLEAMIGRTMVPVFRWSAAASTLLSQGTSEVSDDEQVPSRHCREFFYGDKTSVTGEFARQLSEKGWCYWWDVAASELSASTAVRFEHVGDFVLTLHVPQPEAPSEARLACVGLHLCQSARDIAQQ